MNWRCTLKKADWAKLINFIQMIRIIHKKEKIVYILGWVKEKNLEGERKYLFSVKKSEFKCSICLHFAISTVDGTSFFQSSSNRYSEKKEVNYIRVC